jgi:hypothetical protein
MLKTLKDIVVIKKLSDGKLLIPIIQKNSKTDITANYKDWCDTPKENGAEDCAYHLS